MTLLPKVKLKAQVNFPACSRRRRDRRHQEQRRLPFDLDFGDFAPPVTGIDLSNQNTLLWDNTTGAYSLVPAVLFAGGISPSNISPLIDGTASPGAALTYSRGDHIHPVSWVVMTQAAYNADHARPGPALTSLSDDRPKSG